MRQFSDSWRGLRLAKGPHGVSHPDHPVSGPGGDPGQEPGPPAGQDVPPRLLVHLALKELDPVRAPGGVAQSVLPVQRVDRPATAGQLVEPAQVPVGPPVDQRILIPAS